MYSHILIPIDGSDLSQQGLDHGLALAKSLGSKVTILTVTTPFPPIAGTASSAGWYVGRHEIDQFEAQEKRRAEDLLANAEGAAAKLDLEATLIQTSDHSAAMAIVDTARDLDCNLIVIASHGHRGIRRMLLGSQTAEVLATAHIPVLVVR